MQIENLPYPVYCDGSPAYFGTFFSVDINQIEADDPLHFAVRGRFSINNAEIISLIAADKAGFGLLIECDQTDYSELRPCAMNFEEKLIKAFFANVVTITPVIYAKVEIEHYHNDDLIDEYNLQDITLPQGAIIAADGELELTIVRSQPQTVEAICKLRSDIVPGYDIEDDSIILSVPPDVYKKYSKMGRNQKIQVTAMYFPPVLQSILSNIFSEGDCNYSDRKWYEAIKRALDIKGIDPEKNEPYNVMMEIIGDFMAEGTEFIQTKGGDSQ